MSALVSAPLTAHLSQPQERAHHHLPPKSYAEATVEGINEDVRRTRHEANGTAYLNGVNGSPEIKGLSRNIDEDHVICDKHSSQEEEKLTSIKPDESCEEGLKHDAESAPRQRGRSGKKQDPNHAKLASGRRAGAGWERSA